MGTAKFLIEDINEYLAKRDDGGFKKENKVNVLG